MRRHYIWYGLAAGWGLAAFAGFLLRHTPQALPAAAFALLFAIVGIVIGKRDDSVRRRRVPKLP